MINSAYYHIYNRGVEKRKVFNEERDKWRFLQSMALFNDEDQKRGVLWNFENRGNGANMKTLKRYIDKRADDPLVEIAADCLMDNHYHLLLKEKKEDGIAKFMQKLGTGYTMYFNKKYDRTGSLFQGSYKSVRVDNNKYLKYLLIYINVINPIEGRGIDLSKQEGVSKALTFAKQYDWSTHKEYLGKRDSFVINKGIFNYLFESQEKYRQFAKMALEEKKHKHIKEYTLE